MGEATSFFYRMRIRGTLLPLNTPRDVQVRHRRALVGAEDQGFSPVGGQHHPAVLGHHAQQGQAGSVHGVVNGGMEPPQQLGLHPVDHQMDALRPAPHLAHCPLGVPQRRGVGGGDHHRPVAAAYGQLEAGPQSGGGVQKDVVKPLSGLPQQASHGLLSEAVGEGEGGGQQEKAPNVGMLHRRPFQRAAPLEHVGEIHQRPVGQAQRQIQVPQPHVHVDAQRAVTQRGQTGGDRSGQGGLSRSPFSGGDGDHGCHSQKPPTCKVL